MPAVTEKFGTGGANVTPSAQGSPTLATVLRAFVDDVAALRTSITGITAQLDADTGVADTDYAANHDPAAGSVTKG